MNRRTFLFGLFNRKPDTPHFGVDAGAAPSSSMFTLYKSNGDIIFQGNVKINGTLQVFPDLPNDTRPALTVAAPQKIIGYGSSVIPTNVQGRGFTGGMGSLINDPEPELLIGERIDNV
jgi:hypothetical protein